jgi:hypothetical protein
VKEIALHSEVVNGETVVTLTFPSEEFNGGSLMDGIYSLYITGTEVMAGNLPMVADHVTTFHRLFGDVDGDRDVDGRDVRTIGRAVGSGEGDPDYRRAYDYDGDGDIDQNDLDEAILRWGMRF